MFAFAPFETAPADRLKRLAVLLRLAVILERSRTDADSPAVLARAADSHRLELNVPADWLEGHALSRSELVLEQARLGEAGFELDLVSRS